MSEALLKYQETFMSNIDFCYCSMNDTTLGKKIEFLIENPVFRNRFGHELDTEEGTCISRNTFKIKSTFVKNESAFY